MTALAVAVGLLAVLTLLNLFILLGVIRRLRTMAASAAEPSAEGVPAPGTAVGAFSLTDTDGHTVTEADVATGQSLVLMLSPSCGPCKTTVDKLAAERGTLPDRTFVFLRADFEDPELPDILAKLAGVGTIIEFGGQDGIEDALSSRGYPTALLIEDGVIAAASYKYAEVLPDRVSA